MNELKKLLSAVEPFYRDGASLNNLPVDNIGIDRNPELGENGVFTTRMTYHEFIVFRHACERAVKFIEETDDEKS